MKTWDRGAPGVGSGVRVLIGGKILLTSPEGAERFWDLHNLLFNMNADSLCGVNRVGHEFDHLLLYSAEVTKKWSYTSTPLICFHGVFRDNLTFFCGYGIRVFTSSSRFFIKCALSRAVFSTFVRPRPGKLFFHKTGARSQQIYS